MIVAVPGHAPEKCLGVRDGFLRYAHELLQRDLPVTVRPFSVDEPGELTLTDPETLSRAHQLVDATRASCPDATFVVGAEEGLGELRVGGEVRHVVKTWVVVQARGLDPDGKLLDGWGSSGGLQIPTVLFDHLDQGTTPWMPTTRRGGGMMKSVTQDLESRRSCTALATFLALNSLLYGRLA